MYNKTNINPIYVTEESIRILSRVDYYEPTNILFDKVYALKFDFLHCTVNVYKVYNNLLTNCIQRLFEMRESQYKPRGMYILKK